MSRAACLAVVGLLAGCGPIRFHFHQHASGGPALAVTGSTVRLSVFVNTPGGDTRTRTLPSNPLCAVTGPSGDAVECAFSDWSTQGLDEDDGVATLTFKPLEPGWYDATATLPEGGLISWRLVAIAHVQGDVLAQLQRGCSWVERLGAEAWLCDDVVLRDGAPPQFLGGELATVGEDTVWTWNAGELRRFRDPGSGPLTPEPTARLDTRIFDVTVLFATRLEALLVHPGGMMRAEVDSSGALQDVARLERAFSSGLVVTRLGDVVMTAETAGEEVEVCTWLLSPGAIAPGACRRYPGRVLGRGDGGLLLQSGMTLRRVTPSLDDGVEGELPVSINTANRLAGRGLVILAGGIIPRVEGTTLTLESVSGVSGATEGFVWGTSKTATTVWRR